MIFGEDARDSALVRHDDMWQKVWHETGCSYREHNDVESGSYDATPRESSILVKIAEIFVIVTLDPVAKLSVAG